MQHHFLERSWLKDILFLTLSLIVLFGSFLGVRPLSVPDEARYSEIPREMIELGDYLTPHLNYIKYFEKPPLLYWLQAGAIKSFGYSEWALRLPTAILALLGCLMIYAAGRTLYDRRTGLLSSIILATSLLYFAMAHLITLDMTVTVFVTGCLLAFIIGIKQKQPQQRRLMLWLCYSCAALGVLAKGLIGIVLPGIVVFTWLLIYHEWRLLKQVHLISGCIIFLLIAAPWFILVQQANPEFFHFFFIEQHFSRYLTLSAGRYKPVWFFGGILLIGLFPWTVFLFQSLYRHLPKRWQERHTLSTEGFLILWAVLIFIFFSISKSKLIPYILPVFPPLALLIGHYLASQWDNPVTKGTKTGFWLLPFFAVGIAATLIALPYYQTVSDPNTAAFYLRLMAAILIITAILSSIVFWRKQFRAAFITLIAGTMLELITFIVTVPYVDTRSIKPLAEKLRPLLKTSDEVACYGIYFQDLPYYLQRKVIIVDWTNELTFGMQHQDARDWMLNSEQFFNRWRSDKVLYAVMAKNFYAFLQNKVKLPMRFIADTTDNVLVTNR